MCCRGSPRREKGAPVPDQSPAPVAGRRDPFAPLLENPLAELLRRHARAGAATHAVPTAGAPQPVTLYDDGRHRINLGSNNYLGLANDPRVIEAATAALRQFGTSTSGSRVLNGTTRLHLELEEELADHYGTEAAVLTSSGINANLALLSTLGSPGDVLLVDAHAHASVHAGAAASRGTLARFRHNDLESLRERLDELDPRAGVAIVVDGVYSMSGEIAPLSEIAQLCDGLGARLVVDEAHGLGVLGAAGRGAVEHAGVLDRVDAVTVAFSKSLASVGGAVMTTRAAAEGIRASALPYVFSAGNDPASVGAAAHGTHRCRGTTAAGKGRGHRRPHRRGGGDRRRVADRLPRRCLLQRGRVSGSPAREGRAAAVGDGHAHRRAVAACRGRRRRRCPADVRTGVGPGGRGRLTGGDLTGGWPCLGLA